MTCSVGVLSDGLKTLYVKMLLFTALLNATGKAPCPLHLTLTLKGTADL